MTTTTLDISTVGTSTTTSTRTHSTCDKIRGCQVNDNDWETTTRISCSTRIAIRGEVEANPTPTPEPLIRARNDDDCLTEEDIIIYPKNPVKISKKLEDALSEPVDPGQPDGEKWEDRMIPVMIGDEDDHFVAFIYIPAVRVATWEAWRADKSWLEVISIKALGTAFLTRTLTS
jgi:hypothetical protein